MRIFLIAVCLVFVIVRGEAQPRTATIDSLTQLLDSHPSRDTLRVRMLVNLARTCVGMDNNKAFRYAVEADSLSKKLNYQRGKLLANNALAVINMMLAEYQQGIDHCMQALSQAEALGDIAEKGESCRILAMTYVNLGEHKKAGPYYQDAAAAARTSGDHVLLTKSMCALGMWYLSMNNPDSARWYLHQSLAVADKHNVSYFRPHILGHIGRLGDFPDARAAIAYEVTALEAARAVENRAAEQSILTDLGYMYRTAKNYPQAEKYLLEALQLTRHEKLSLQRPYIYESLVNLAIQQGKLSEAKHYLDAYIACRDSIFHDEKSRQIAHLETQFNTEKKEQTIQLLEQKMALEALWKKALVLIAIVLLVLSGVIYKLQRSRHNKARQLLEIQKQLNEKLQEADVLRSRFFASISHEFRTPIALILAPLEKKINSPGLSAADKEDLRLVMRNANRLADLVNQVLDLSKLEARKMEVQWQRGNLHGFFMPLVSSFESLAISKDIHFTYGLTVFETPCAFDPDKLEKIVTNLLSNAFKFTPAGGSVRIYVQQKSSDRTVFIRIEDTGRGIPVEDIPHVFSPFYQSGKAENTSLPGTGLGLALVHELVHVLGGIITLNSDVEKGTIVQVSLPLHDEAANMADAVIPMKIKSETIVPEIVMPVTGELFSETLLIVEDNQELRRFISDHFRMSFNILTATQGKEALDMAFECIPSLIISDVMMPEMDGVEFLKRIKSDDRTNHIPVILLTARAGEDEKIAALQLGSEEYLAKPFSINELDVRVKGIIENRKRLAVFYKNMFRLAPALSRHEKIVPTLPVPPSISEKFIDKLITTIQHHLSEPSFSVEVLAAEMCLSRAQLFRKVKMVLDTSPSELISDLRLQHAAKMIECKSDTLAQIAYAVGFTEQSYFAKRFRKKYGVSPREYSERMSA